MKPESLEFQTKSRVTVSQQVWQKFKNSSPNNSGNAFVPTELSGGVIRNGQLAWYASGSNFEVFSLKTGQRVAGYSFPEKSIVSCVAEVTSTDTNACLLIIGVQRVPLGGMLFLFSVQGSRIVHRIDIVDQITSCCFISEAACKRSSLAAFDGCAAIGTDAGDIFLVNLNLSRCIETISTQTPFNPNSDQSTCKIISAPINIDEIRSYVKMSRFENMNLGIRLDGSVVDEPSSITSILSMAQMQMIAIGFENGILALYNLRDLNALHLAYPPEINLPLVKLTFLEPADDPRPCVYIWAFHANKAHSPYAVMHSVSFTSKTYQDGENIYEAFQGCRPDLTIPIHENDSMPISCQSVTKIVSDEEEEQYSLCLLAWSNRVSSFVLVFDLNQWYKEQMPRLCDWRDYPSYLAPFPIEIADMPMDIWINPKSVVTFNSIQRPEEHFYPTSLSFEIIELTSTEIYQLHWAGLQNNAIKKLSQTGAVAILVPDDCFAEFLEASLIPQLSEQNYHASPSKTMKQEFLLSMALEYNCMKLLRECAQQWADGSHMGRGASEGLTLSTLTEWIWKQATLIKDRCNYLCVSLFDDTGITIDLRSRKILAHYSRQLKLLADLLNMIITNYRQYIPDEIFDTLTAQRNSIRMTSEYQEVLQWLLNMGLLPEIVWNQLSLPEARHETLTAIPYPYRLLNKFYTDQRQRFYDIDRSNLAAKTNSCKCLFIDSFIDRECNSHLLRNEWGNGHGDGLYPPPSLQAMLRILLIPGISLENKYMLFVYLFLDLNMVLEGEPYFNVVQNLIKFPAVFKLNSSLIKTTQAFWNLDHNEYEIALKELISPLTSGHFIKQWQQELLVNTLLIRDMPNLALQAIRAPGPPIDTSLRIRTLLANTLVTEAFELQRSKCNDDLLVEFYKGCHEHKKWNCVLGLSLTEREGAILCKFLQNDSSLLADNLQLLYLLQRNKYIEALTYLDDIKYKPRAAIMQRKLKNTQDAIISSYKLAMNKTQSSLCDQYMEIKSRLEVDVEQSGNTYKPLSSQLNPYLMDSNANVVGSVFHRAIVGAKRTGHGFSDPKRNHIPLLGNLRIEFGTDEIIENTLIVKPKPYVGIMKRRKEISYECDIEPDQKQPAAKRQRTDAFVNEPPTQYTSAMDSFIVSSQSQKAPRQSERMDCDESMERDNAQRNSMGELCETVNLLSTPVVKSSRSDKHRMESRCQTPQSILKQRHTDIGSTISRRSTSPSLHSTRRSVDFNAKSYLYTIPAANEEYRLDSIQEAGNVVDDDDSSSVYSPSSIRGRRSIHSGKNSTASNSMDEFYSPETSKVEERSAQAADMSHISHPDAVPSTSNVPTSRRARSKTPEVTSVLSSTRITRSRSKLNLEDSVNDDSVTQEPVLNTSTPKRTTPKRSSSQSLSKNIITANALKALEVNRRAMEQNDSSVESISTPQRNYLKDASDMSLRAGMLNYTVDELDATQPNQNLLQDSTYLDITGVSFYSSDKRNELLEQLDEEIKGEIQAKIDHQIDNADMGQEHTAEDEELEQQNESEVLLPQVDVQSTHQDEQEAAETIIDNEPQIEPQNEPQNQPQNELEKESEKEPESEIQQQYQPDAELHYQPEIEPQNEPENDVEMDDIEMKCLPTESESSSYQADNAEAHTTRSAQNYLIDSSAPVSESMLQAFNKYDQCTTSFFNETEPAHNFLEDSSICQTTSVQGSSNAAVAADEANDREVVNLDDFDYDSKSPAISNNTISSDSDDSNENYSGENMGRLEYEESVPDDGVIELSSGSDDEKSQKSIKDSEYADSPDQYRPESADSADQSENSSSTDQYEDLKYDINNEFGTTSQLQNNEYAAADDYHLTELQSSSMPAPQTEEQSLSQEQEMNLIYGSLGDPSAEILDFEDDNEAFVFQSRSTLSDQHEEAAYLASADIVTSTQATSTAEVTVETTQSQDEPTEPSEQQIDPVDTYINRDDDVLDIYVPTLESVTEVQTAEESNAGDQDEPNVLNQAIVYNPTKAAASDETVDQMPLQTLDSTQEHTDVEPMETEQTNMFENAAMDSAIETNLTVAKTSSEPHKSEEITSEEDVEMVIDESESATEKEQEPVEEKPVKKASKKETKVKVKEPSTPARRTRRVASQQETLKEEPKANDDDLAGTKPTRSKVRKAQSQQTLSQGDGDANTAATSEQMKSTRATRVTSQQRDVRGQSKERDFDITLHRMTKEEVDYATQRHKEDRKKRGASEQKNFKIELEPLSPEELAEATGGAVPARKKRGASQQKETAAKQEPEPSTSRASRQKGKASTSSDLGDTFDAEEAASSRRMRKATSHQSLSDIPENASVEPKKGRTTKKKTEGAPRRAASHQSLSSIDSGSQPDEEKPQRKLRSRSVSMEEINQPTRPRTRRAASQQQLDDIDETEEVKGRKRPRKNSDSTDNDSELGETFDENESGSSRRLRKAVSHQVLTKIVESEHEDSPSTKGRVQVKKEPATRARRAASHQSLSSIGDEDTKDAKKTKSKKRTNSESKDETESTSSRTTRSGRAPSESKSPNAAEVKKTRSNKKKDDAQSEASSVVSTRSRRASKDDETSSEVSTRVKTTRSGSVLPAIDENEVVTSPTLSQEYLETSRLTRSQRANIEKYSKAKVAETSVQRTTRKKKDTTEATGSDHSDTESVISTTSKTSKRSKTSEVSMSQRSTRQRK